SARRTHGRAPGRPSRRPCGPPRPRSFHPSSPPPFPCLRWLEGTPLPSAFGSFGFSRSASPLEDALLALLDELANLLAALSADPLVERRTVLVANGLAALSPSELTTLAADLLVELHAPLVADALAALPAGFRDRHAALSIAAGLDHRAYPFPRLFLHRLRVGLAARRRRALVGPADLGGGLLALLDQGAHAVAALLADLLVERSASLRLDRFPSLLADLLVEAGAALRLDRVTALLADLL